MQFLLNALITHAHDHAGRIATAILLMAVGWCLGRRRALSEWRHKDFYNRINISLTAIREGTLVIRTVSEASCLDVFSNAIAVSELAEAARETPPEQPLLNLPDEEYWFYLNAVLTEVSKQFDEGQLKRDMGLPVTSRTYAIALTNERDRCIRTHKVRAILVQKSLLENLPPEQPRFECAEHSTRWSTLCVLADEFRRHPQKFLTLEICV